jgi:hypothetical protein
MPRPCLACTHPERQLIDADLLPVEPFRRVVVEEISRRYGISPRSLARHRDEHLAPQVSRGIQRRHEDVRIADLVDRVLAQVGAASDIRDHAMREGDGRLALLASREERDAVAFLLDRLKITRPRRRSARWWRSRGHTRSWPPSWRTPSPVPEPRTWPTASGRSRQPPTDRPMQ